MKSWQSRSAGYLLLVLFLVNVMSFLDRQVLAIVQESMKVDLNLTDADLGWLQLGFGLALALCAVPVGRIADNISRKTVLVFCLSLWSGATAAAGLANNFFTILVARIGVGMGEAGVTPTSYAMISDKIKIERRATALAIVGAGIPVGVALSLVLGGQIAESLGWRWAFILFGLPGLLLAAVIYLTISTPTKGEADGVENIKKTLPMKETLAHLFSTRSFTLVLIGTATKSIAGAALLNWMPSLIQRKFDMGAGEVGATFGPLIGVVSLIALVGAAYIGDRLSRRDFRWYSWIVAGSQVVALPLVLLGLFSESYLLTLVFFGLSTLFSQSMLAISNALIQNTSPIQMRSMASALKSLALTFLGFGLGSFLVGQLSEHVFNTGDEAVDLMFAMAVAACAHIIAAVCYFASAFYLRDDIEKAKQFSSAENKDEPKSVDPLQENPAQ